MKRLTDKPVEWCGWKCHIDAGQYDNGRIALELVVAKEHDEGIEGERITVCTVNLVDAFCGPRQVYVKEWNENAGMTLLLIQNDIITPEPQREAASGHIVARCYDLTDAAFAKLCGLPAPVVVQYLVSLTLKPGMPATDAPAEDAILGALEVGTEGSPDGMRFEGVEEIHVQDHAPEPDPAVLDALRAILGVLNQDDDGDYFICKEAEQTIAHCRAIAEGAKGADFYHLDDREHATVLAALRYWQREGGIMALREWDIASNDETLVPLDDKDIDALCERLNCGG